MLVGLTSVPLIFSLSVPLQPRAVAKVTLGKAFTLALSHNKHTQTQAQRHIRDTDPGPAAEGTAPGDPAPPPPPGHRSGMGRKS